MNEFHDSIAELGSRIALRTWLLMHGVASAAFWALFLACWTLLANAGFSWVGWTMLAVYVAAAAPFLIIQVVLIADLLACLVLGRIFAYPAIDKTATDYATAHPDRVTNIPRPVQIFFFLADASPLSCFAMWSMVVLARMPESVHGKLPLRELKRREIVLERAIYAQATARLGFAQ